MSQQVQRILPPLTLRAVWMSAYSVPCLAYPHLCCYQTEYILVFITNTVSVEKESRLPGK